ncbi:hypothetical protein CGRA01v4_14253 [Colletotrichum graminicola]|nr:hypothetical protein CGRA01v4_14253 [Colletotrichum graminicola]
MSSITVYDAVIPLFINGLKTFDHILSKAEEYAKANNIDANTYPEARLVEDQLPLTFQVQNATKTVKTNVGRLTGVELEPFENKEKTIEDLHKRIEEALDLLSKVDAATVNAKADDQVDLTDFWWKDTEGFGKRSGVEPRCSKLLFPFERGICYLEVKRCACWQGRLPWQLFEPLN